MNTEPRPEWTRPRLTDLVMTEQAEAGNYHWTFESENYNPPSP